MLTMCLHFTTNLVDNKKHLLHKKVLLRERKRHTARHVASACFADLSPDGGGDTPSSPRWRGTPSSLGWGGGTPGYPPF